MANSYLFVPIAMNMKGDVASNWKFFKEQWQNYEVASGLAQKEANVRLATLTVVTDKDCYEILQRLPDSESKTMVEETLTALEQYFIPKRNVTYERFVFNNCHQGTRETVDEYVTKLHSLNSTCEFGALTDDLISDRLLLGTKLDQVRPKLLSEADLTLQKALEICRSCEQTQRQLRDINNPTEKTYAVSRSASQRKGGLPNCKYCNRKHEFSKGKCPAYGKQCRNCGKQHHFAICCKVKRNEHSSWVMKENNGSPLYYASNTVCQISPKGT